MICFGLSEVNEIYRNFTDLQGCSLCELLSIWCLAGMLWNHPHSRRIAKISELVRFENKYHLDRNVAQKLSGEELDCLGSDSLEVLLQIQAIVMNTMLKEEFVDHLHLLKELDSGYVLASYRTSNIPALFSQLKA
ncbi:hypothetical protein ACFKIX_000448 [Vibrio alginolyticus]